ncbi:MAG: orotidine-5'-phosphate decarboxylase [Geminicoccaceae bacterium]|nr:orotidine-5'-phosphate decarboxylase [Geminicoccaceae bacterium]
MSDISPIICAIDRPDLDGAMALARTLDDSVGTIKLGLEFLYAQGPAGVRSLGELGRPIFLDAKLNDIPNTVAGAMRGIVELPVAMMTLMASGGSAMMRSACEVAHGSARRPWVLAVTVLTSLDDADLVATGVNAPSTDQALRLAELALEAGCDGIVCSPLEIRAMRERFGDIPKLVVPGIRPNAGTDDQKRTMTPAEALRAGADRLVIGRPITQSADPARAASDILAGLAEAA